MQNIRKFIKIADIIREALVELRANRYKELLRRLAILAGIVRELAGESGKMGLSLSRRWFSSVERSRGCIRRVLGEIPSSVSKILPLAEGPRKELPNLSLLVEELKQLQDEFGDLEFDDEQRILSVVTEPITLEDVYLGPFKIQLGLDKLSQLHSNSPYFVIALDPNPAATNEDVTHPHVNSEKLCEGDGILPLKHALEQGRICDFFTMVRSILNTYNQDSPYVSLAEWEGMPCHNCGYVMSSEDAYHCCHCENYVCDECSTFCQDCSEVFCLECAGSCENCQQMVCNNCVLECAGCGELFCKICLEEDICTKCKQESEVQENEEQQEGERKADDRAADKAQSQTNDTPVRLAS